MTPSEFADLKAAALRRYFSRMNAPQFEAVTTVQGPVLVLAGAGSGKTTVIVGRIAHMILFGDALHTPTPIPGQADLDRLRAYAEGRQSLTQEELRDLIAADPVPPWRILAITFTNKAAGEMKARLAKTLGDTALDIHAATFHSACVRILRSCIDRLGYASGFTIYDSDDSVRVMKTCMKELNISEKKFTPKAVLHAVSAAKDAMLSPEDYAQEAGNDYWKSVAARLYRAYQQRLLEANAVDFDDLICLTVRVFEECPDVLEKYRRRYQYLLVDEYQDTNHAQYRLVSLLAGGHGNLCVVGDDDQSIYRFRGATIENILCFEEQFPGCRTIRLEENYRSTQHILDAANAVIAHNESRKEKALWTSAGDGEQVTLVRSASERLEGDFIVDTIREAVGEGRTYDDFAVLYRINALSNSIERSLVRAKLPYRIYGGVRFQDRREIRDVTAYLCLLDNPHDSVRFERIVNVPKRGIGEGTVATILQISHDLHMSPLEVVKSCRDFPVLAKRQAALLRFDALMDALREAAEALPLEELFDEVLEQTGYRRMLEAEGEQGETRLENVEEYRSNIVDYVRNAEDPTLQGFLEETALYTDADRDTEGPHISLMTIHAAKGLEFDTVFTVGAEQGIFPSQRSMDSLTEMEEERRLCYVMMTRAKRHLYLMQSQSRLLFGRYQNNPLSRFVREIPEAHLHEVGNGTEGAESDAPAASGIAGIRRQMAAISGYGAPVGEAPALTAGDRVLDRNFGEGTVLRAEPMAGDCLLEIAFDKVGTKKLMARYRKLIKL
ncbi:MAG: UvrD-helicase domain-containing protein [Oscillospiraceae bacterium]|nr:UvrD-helicase domain-containing protein [Oscillospiraceae bacterium]